MENNSYSCIQLMTLSFKPLIADNFNDLIILFGEKGACGGCWCMWWRLKNKDYEQSKGIRNKELLENLISNSKPLGIIAYEKNNPIGWCSISPRKSLKRLETSKLFKPIDNLDVWSITCLYVDKKIRNTGLSVRLINQASEFAFKKGATCIEAYPIHSNKNKTPDLFAYVGFKTAYLNAGFEPIKQCSKTRLIMRKYYISH